MTAGEALESGLLIVCMSDLYANNNNTSSSSVFSLSQVLGRSREDSQAEIENRIAKRGAHLVKKFSEYHQGRGHKEYQGVLREDNYFFRDID